MTTLATPREVLDTELIARCGSRAGGYDRENRFFQEDFDELVAAGYLKMAIPTDLGGLGMTLAEVANEEGRLAYRAPATALATNMHLYWTGVAADLRRMGDTSLEWLLREAAAGEVFAAGHGEVGNDLPLLLSTASAKRVDGGYRVTGHKIFGSLTPVWTRFGLHAMDTESPEGPTIVHAFMPRDAVGYKIQETWDTLGMRATRSDDTILDDVFVPDRFVSRVIPAGVIDAFVLSIFAWAEVTFASIYLGVGARARDLAVEGAHKRTSLAMTRSMAYHPEYQHAAAEMVMALEPAAALVRECADEWSASPPGQPDLPMRFIAAKHIAVEAAKRVVDLAMAMSGGGGMFKGNELERLYRDARCGGFHPASTLLVHELVGKMALGVDLGEKPRWG